MWRTVFLKIAIKYNCKAFFLSYLLSFFLSFVLSLSLIFSFLKGSKKAFLFVGVSRMKRLLERHSGQAVASTTFPLSFSSSLSSFSFTSCSFSLFLFLLSLLRPVLSFSSFLFPSYFSFFFLHFPKSSL